MALELNKVYCMDCLEGMRLLDDNSIDLVVTDPPYFIENLKEDLSEQTIRGSSKNSIFFNAFDHFENKKAYIKFIKAVLIELKRVLKPNGQVYMFFSYHHIDWVIGYLKNNFRFYKPLIWYKPDTMGVFPNQYGCNYENVLWFRKHSDKLIKNKVKFNIGCSQRDVFTCNSTNINYRTECGFHPTPKPISIIRTFVKNGSDKGDVILDPFMGSGTTAVACKQTGRVFVGFENNKDYYDIITKRLCQNTLLTLEGLENDTTRTDKGVYEGQGQSPCEGDGAGTEYKP